MATVQHPGSPYNKLILTLDSFVLSKVLFEQSNIVLSSLLLHNEILSSADRLLLKVAATWASGLGKGYKWGRCLWATQGSADLSTCRDELISAWVCSLPGVRFLGLLPSLSSLTDSCRTGSPMSPSSSLTAMSCLEPHAFLHCATTGKASGGKISLMGRSKPAKTAAVLFMGPL